jgi:hypothetical protein
MMIISVRNLRDNMGVDEKIARFFVDRKVPLGNAFWNKRLLYINRGNGYVSIPVYYDILFRMGIPQSTLLEEQHIQFMEQVMHYAILHEMGQISFTTQIDSIGKLLTGRLKNAGFYAELLPYLGQKKLLPMGKLGMQVPALNRADVFLFILCDLPLGELQNQLAVKYWSALHSTYLLMDDINDYPFDKQNRDENAIVELGDDKEGFSRAFTILNKNIAVLEEINPSLGQWFNKSLDNLTKLVP